MTRILGRIALPALTSAALFWQNSLFSQTPPGPAAANPSFELADIHTSTPTGTQILTGTRGAVIRASGRYEFTNATMVDLIRTAYNVDADKVQGGPSWLESDRFDIIAKAPPKTTPDDAKLMLRSLLADRFKLLVHQDLRPLPSYALSVSKTGHKLKEADGSGQPGCQMTIQQNAPAEQQALQSALQAGSGSVTMRIATFLYTCHGVTMASFAEQMHTMIVSQTYLGNNPIGDQTDLKGSWDFDFKYTQKPPANGASNDQTIRTANGTVQVTMAGEYISLFDAMEKQLGLKLSPATIPTPVIVVDSAERKPTENPPDVTAKLPPPPAGEFEAAEIRMSAPGAPGPPQAPNRITNTQLNLNAYPLKSLIALGWNLNDPNQLVGGPKWLDNAKVDVIAKVAATNGPANQAADIDSVIRPAVRALLIDRFKVALHTEKRPGTGWVLSAVKPKLTPADPKDRTLCKEGPGKDGKDPRTGNSVLSRLVTCQNMTMKEFAQQLPLRASGYIRPQEQVVDATGLTGAFDFTVNFSPPGLVPGALNGAVVIVGGRGGDAPSAGGPGGASDPNGAISIQEALSKQLGLKLEQQKRDIEVLVLDHIEEKPTE